MFLIGNGTSGTRSGAVHSISRDSRRGNCLRWGENAVVKEQVYRVAAATLQIKNNQIYVAKRR